MVATMGRCAASCREAKLNLYKYATDRAIIVAALQATYIARQS
jgi:hypothetical protein